MGETVCRTHGTCRCAEHRTSSSHCTIPELLWAMPILSIDPEMSHLLAYSHIGRGIAYLVFAALPVLSPGSHLRYVRKVFWFSSPTHPGSESGGHGTWAVDPRTGRVRASWNTVTGESIRSDVFCTIFESLCLFRIVLKFGENTKMKKT